ncbi:MAG: NAD(P)-dependent oxidoreductase [Hyphomicrobiales bacterium]|nr:NAD(P)-dependent oxidoreductase [Hyphomicrobiales bacterium]
MRVMVAGATGAVGVRLIPLLVSAGHEVTGLTRSPAKTGAIERAGARSAVADALDSAAVRAAVLDARPEVVVHEVTALRNASDLTHFDRAFAVTNRLRTEGLDHLLDAAKAAGARRVVAQSFCGWPYARTGGPVKTEEDPLDPTPPREFRNSLDAIRHVESVVAGATAFEGLVLRYGGFYGPGSGVFDGPLVDQLRRRRIPLIGDAGGWWSFLHVDDAAAATALAVEKGAPGLYNIVDDEPAPVSAWLPALASMIGAKPPWRIPRWLARIAAGEHMVALMTESRAGSNLKARGELGWAPAHPSWRQGFSEVLAAANR